MVYDLSQPTTRDLILEPEYDVPTEASWEALLWGLQYAPENVKNFCPIGAELYGSIDGNDNPWIIAHYQEQPYQKGDTTKTGMTAILLHKYVYSVPLGWTSSNYVGYGDSTCMLRTYLNTTYLSNCNVEAQKNSVATDIVCNLAMHTTTTHSLKCFAPSAWNTNLATRLPSTPAQGDVWEFFQQTDASAHDTADKIRIGYSVASHGSALQWVTRSSNGSSTGASYYVSGINASGAIVQLGMTFSSMTVYARPAITVAP